MNSLVRFDASDPIDKGFEAGKPLSFEVLAKVKPAPTRGDQQGWVEEGTMNDVTPNRW
jgi:hypothetical protein